MIGCDSPVTDSDCHLAACPLKRPATMAKPDRRYFVDLDDSLAIPLAFDRQQCGDKSDGIFMTSSFERIPSPNEQIQEFTSDSGRWQVKFSSEKLVGYGRYSRVYKGDMYSANCCETITVAVKVHQGDTDSLLEAENEASMLRKFEGTCGIVHFYDTCFAGPKILLLQFAKEGSLASRIFSTDEISETQVLNWVNDLFKALCALEDQNILHLDVKPHNLLLNDDRLVLSDFGSALELPILRTAARSKGTLSYSAPELLLIDDEWISTTASDIYSAGIVIYSLLTRREPFCKIDRPGVALVIAIKQGFLSGDHNPWVNRSCLSFGNFEILKEIAIDCLSSSHSERPTAKQVLSRLQTLEMALDQAR